MRQPFELGLSPEASTSTPVFTSSSWYFCIVARSFSPGMAPASESWVALTMIMNRIVLSPCKFNFTFEIGCTVESNGYECLPDRVKRPFSSNSRSAKPEIDNGPLILQFGEPPLKKPPLGLLPCEGKGALVGFPGFRF